MTRLKLVLVAFVAATVWSGFDSSADAQILRRRSDCCDQTCDTCDTQPECNTCAAPAPRCCATPRPCTTCAAPEPSCNTCECAQPRRFRFARRNTCSTCSTCNTAPAAVYVAPVSYEAPVSSDCGCTGTPAVVPTQVMEVPAAPVTVVEPTPAPVVATTVPMTVTAVATTSQVPTTCCTTTTTRRRLRIFRAGTMPRITLR